jgi:vanillate/3-O-methylgallate O-demethylase
LARIVSTSLRRCQQVGPCAPPRGSRRWDEPDIEGLCRSPGELGWSKSIKFDHDFIGREALEKEVAEPRRAGVTLEFNNEDMIEIYVSPFSDGDTYRKVLVISFLDAEHSELDTEVKVRWGSPDEPQREIRATVARRASSTPSEEAQLTCPGAERRATALTGPRPHG